MTELCDTNYLCAISSGYRFTFKDTSNNDLLVQSDTLSIVAKGDDTTTVTSGTSTSATSATAYPASSSTTATTTRLNASSTSCKFKGRRISYLF